MTNHKSQLAPLCDVMKGLVHLLLMADNRELKGCYAVSDNNLFLSVSVYYSTDVAVMDYMAFLMSVSSSRENYAAQFTS